MLNRGVPVLFGDAEAGVRGLHVAADINAGSAGCRAQLVDDQLAYPLDRVGPVPDEELGELRIGLGFTVLTALMAGHGHLRTVLTLDAREIGCQVTGKEMGCGPHERL